MRFRAPRVAVEKPKTDAELLDSIRHPRWSRADDLHILQAKKQRKDFSAIAGEMDRQRIAVEQRYHRLRSIPNIERLLSTQTVATKRYDLPARAGNGRS